MWILVVDDEFPGFLLESLSKDTGVPIRLARTENEALASFKEWQADKPAVSLILMDGHLASDPGRPADVDTTQLARYIREQGYTDPLIAISFDDGTQTKLLQAGCSEAWSKFQVTRLLRKWIEEHAT